jgi:hypothetical protein
MTEQEIQAMLEQLKHIDLFAQIPGYNAFPKANKEAIITALQTSIDKEKAKIANEQ